MRRQRNMTQLKDRRKVKRKKKELNEMEVSNLSVAEFKTLVIRMLKELIGYFQIIKKIQAEVKFTLSEI